MTVFGTDLPNPDGTAIRDYIHVADLAEAHVRALAYLEDGGPTITLNVGTGTGSSILEVIEAARQVTQTDIRVLPGERRPGDPVAVWADSTLARATLGWEPRYGLTEIVASAWNWHQPNLRAPRITAP